MSKFTDTLENYVQGLDDSILTDDDSYIVVGGTKKDCVIVATRCTKEEFASLMNRLLEDNPSLMEPFVDLGMKIFKEYLDSMKKIKVILDKNKIKS